VSDTLTQRRAAERGPSPLLTIRGILSAVAVCVLTFVLFWPAAISGALGLRATLGAWTMRTYGRKNLSTSGIQVTTSGLDNVPETGGFVLVANHESHWDGVCLIARIPRTLCIVGKKELFWIPVFGWALHALGFVPLDRQNKRRAKSGMHRVEEELRAGEGVMLFPEGTRGLTDALLPFKRGGFVAAIHAGVPVLPVGISGTRARLAPGEMLTKPGRVHLTVGPALSTEGLAYEDRRSLTERAQRAVEQLRREAASQLGPSEPAVRP